MKASKREIRTYSKKQMVAIIRKVCKNYQTGAYTLESVCENAGVPYRTFKHWWSMYEKEGNKVGSRWAILAEVAGLWKEAQTNSKNIRDKELVKCAEQMLHKRVEGYYYDADEAIFKMRKDGFGETLVPVGIKKIKKYSHPSDSAIQFVLKNLCPKKYDRFKTEEINLDPYDRDKYKGWTLDELDAELTRAKFELGISNERFEY